MGDLDQKNMNAQQDNEILNALRQVLVISEGKKNINYNAVYCDIHHSFKDVYASEKVSFIFHNIDMRINNSNVLDKDILVSKTQYLLREYSIASDKRIFVKQLATGFIEGHNEEIVGILRGIQVMVGPVKLRSGKVDFISKPKYNNGQIKGIVNNLGRIRGCGKLDVLEQYLLQRLQEYEMPVSEKTDDLIERIEKVYQKEYSREGYKDESKI